MTSMAVDGFWVGLKVMIDLWKGLANKANVTVVFVRIDTPSPEASHPVALTGDMVLQNGLHKNGEIDSRAFWV